MRPRPQDGSGNVPHTAARKLLKDIKKNICGVENTETHEIDQTDYVLGYRTYCRLFALCGLC